jgi:hypothetical protein
VPANLVKKSKDVAEFESRTASPQGTRLISKEGC